MQRPIHVVRLAFALIAVVALVACRTRPFDAPVTADDGPMTSLDLSAPRDLAQSIDLTQPIIDLAQSMDLAQLSPCEAVVQCAADCPPDGIACVSACSPATGALINDAICAAHWCLGGFVHVIDLGPPIVPRCALNAGETAYIDAPGVPSGDCRVCLVNALSGMLGLACPAGDPACMTGCPSVQCRD